MQKFGGGILVDDGFNRPINDKRIRFRPNMVGDKQKNIKWIILITIFTFFCSALTAIAASNVLNSLNLYFSFFVLIFIIFINIFFDAIGTAVTAADETPFHAMASRKVYGAKQAVKLIRNADKVSNFCNDVIGDIASVISGTAGAYIILKILKNHPEFKIADFVLTGFVAALTVGGKALEKSIAIKYSNYIIYKVSILIKFATGGIFEEKQPGKKKRKEKRK